MTRDLLKISIIVPMFNAERFLDRAVESILDQKHVDEILLVNDNSNDNTIEVARSWQKIDSRIVIINSERNVGAGESRNIGIRAAKNNWIAFLDVDDYYYENRFHRAVEVIDQNQDADGVYEAVENVFIDNNAKKIFQNSRPSKQSTLYTMTEVIKPQNLFKDLMAGNKGFFHLNGVLLRKSTFQEIGCFNPKFELTQDTEAMFRYAMIYNLYPGSIDKPVAARLIHDDNRIFKNEEKLLYFGAKKYLELERFGLERKVDQKILKIIADRKIKFCAIEILKWDLYKLYRLKYGFLRATHRFILKRLIRTYDKKYKN